MSAHTKGPWEFHRGDYSFQVEDSDGYWIATVIDNNRAPQNKANARLIAAAPETTSALSAALDDLEAVLPTLRAAGWQTQNEEATIRRGRAAIAKATGATP